MAHFLPARPGYNGLRLALSTFIPERLRAPLFTRAMIEEKRSGELRSPYPRIPSPSQAIERKIMSELNPPQPEPLGEQIPPEAEGWHTAPLAEGETGLEELFPATPATLLRLRIASSGRTIEVRSHQVCEIGRSDPSLGLVPDLDLSQEGSEAIWVSRRHARIFYHDGHFYIEDLGSTNGTYLNNKRLVSGLPYALQDGDELRFGRIVAHVHIE